MDAGLIISILSAVLFILGAVLLQKGSYLLRNGKIADAVIYKNNHSVSPSGGRMYYPVVRFLTHRKEWITEELSIGYSRPKKEGTKVQVVYDPEDPTNVEINSMLQLELLPRLLVALGIGGIVLGALEYLNLI